MNQTEAYTCTIQKQQIEFRPLAEQNLKELPNAAVCETFRCHCAICNRYAASSISMTNHHLSEHADAYKKHHLYLQKLKAMVAQLNLPNSPCAFCKISVKKFHSCVILKQLALLFAHHHLEEDTTFTPIYPTGDDLPWFKCQHCDKLMPSANALDLHLLMHDDQTGVFDAMRDINPDYSCAHCGLGHNSHTNAMKHINSGSCPEFDINKPCITLMDKDEQLAHMIKEGKVLDILQKDSYLSTLDTTCVLCLKTFDRRKNLQQHLTVVHAKHWKNAADLAIAINSRFRKIQHCCCKPVMKYKDKPHMCIVFRQFALLRTVKCPDADNTALITGKDGNPDKEYSPDKVDTRAVTSASKGLNFEDFPDSQEIPDEILALGLTENSSTEIPPIRYNHFGIQGETLECDDYTDFQEVPDDVLASGLQQLMAPSTPSLSIISWLQTKIHDEMNDIEAFNQLVTQKTHDRFPDMSDLVLGLDFRDLKYASALDDLSRRCAFCEASLWPQSSWQHVLTHLPDTLHEIGDLMEQFTSAYLPLVDTLYDVSSLKFRIALQQIFVLRSILLTNDGCGPGQTFRTRDTWAYLLAKEDELPGMKPSKRPGGSSTMTTRSNDSSEALIAQLTRLVLRHEDQLKAINTEMEYVVHLGMGKGSIIPSLMKTSQTWHADSQQKASLRQTLCLQMMDLIIQRMQPLLEAKKDSPCFKAALQENLLTADGLMPYLRWDKQQQILTPSKETPLSREEVMNLLTETRRLMEDPLTIIRFHSRKKLKDHEDASVKTIPWLLVCSNRLHPAVWTNLKKLCFHATWQLIVARCRSSTQARSPLAIQLSKQLR